MRIYRLHRAIRRTADPTGAILAGGRWNPAGTPMLYATRTLSLACLEVLVHLDKSQLPFDHVWSGTNLDEEPELLLFRDLRDERACQAAGKIWVNKASQLAAQVPSIIIPEESNVLLIPNHTLYGHLSWSTPKPFRFDQRLFSQAT